jgi:hypothetical protein
MKTGIYVQETTSITVSASTSADSPITLEKFADPGGSTTVATSNTVTLSPGIYRIISAGTISITGAGVKLADGTSRVDLSARVTVLPSVGDKDPWPIPPIRAAPEAGGTLAEFIKFVTLAKAFEDP